MNVWIVSATNDGLDLAALLAPDHRPAGMIGLSERAPDDAISGYVHCEPECRKLGIPFFPVDDYSLRSQNDRDRLSRLDIDVLVVTGWQRLIPQWLIEQCSKLVIGIHGSPWGIARGRGRSPQNWALILGEPHFHLSAFRITPEIDAGAVLASRTFEYTPWDDIKTSHQKVTMLYADMLHELFDKDDAGLETMQEQREEEAAYLPKRTPGDGGIDWTRPAERIHDFVRAQTRPYPGAFTTLQGRKMHIWEAVPISLGKTNAEPGRVVNVFRSGEALVAAGEGMLLVRDWTSPDGGEFTQGAVCDSESFAGQMQRIVERHQTAYPDLPVAKEILDLATP